MPGALSLSESWFMEKGVDFSLLLEGVSQDQKVEKNFCQTELSSTGRCCLNSLSLDFFGDTEQPPQKGLGRHKSLNWVTQTGLDCVNSRRRTQSQSIARRQLEVSQRVW